STVFAVVTPPGTAAVATVSVAGLGAWDIVRELFHPTGTNPLPLVPTAERFWSGRFGPPPGDAVVVAARQIGSTAAVEVHCHGGSQAVRLVGDELERRGARAVSPEALLGRCHVRPLTRLALSELTRAPTQRTASILLDQSAGALENALAAIDGALAAGDTAAPARGLAVLVRYADAGRHLTRPWR